MKQLFNSMSNNKFLVIILLVSAVLRFVNISTNPPALNWDEVSHGYNAYSILKSGKDEWGEFLPLIFRAYGDYKLPVYIYSVVPSVAFFGLTEFAVRLPSVLAGIGSVAFSYLLAKELLSTNKDNLAEPPLKPSGGESVALLAALLMALEPWSLFLSRGAFEANLAQCFVIIGVYFLLRFLRQLDRSEMKSKDLIFSLTLLGLSVWTYNSARVFVPLLLAGLVVVFRNELIKVAKTNKKITVYCLLLAALFFLPMFYQLANPAGSARYSKVQILDQGAINKIVESRNTSNLSPLLARAIHNKATYFSREFVTNYFSHFDPRFLFFDGGDQYQFSVPGYGLLYLVNLPFFYLGLVLIIRSVLLLKHDNSTRRRSRNWQQVLIVWLLIAPIPSSLTREAPHVLRSITFLPVPMVVTSLGFVTVLEKSRMYNLKSKISLEYLLLAGYCLLLGLSLYKYMNVYFNDYRTNYSWSWQFGYEDVATYTAAKYDYYDKIIVTKKYGEPHEFMLFYNEWDPESFRNDPNLIRFAQSDWYWVDRFDKYYFVNDWQVNEDGKDPYIFNLESKETVDCNDSLCLLVTSRSNVPDGWRHLKNINFLDGNNAFQIYVNTDDPVF